MENSWLQVMGAEDPQMEEKVSALVNERMNQGLYAPKDVQYVQALTLKALRGDLQISNARLEKLRQLCQIFEVELRPREITSHRKFIGPVIVAAKKLCFPLISFFLKDSMRQQRAFNAGVVALLADLCNEVSEKQQSNSSGSSSNEH